MERDVTTADDFFRSLMTDTLNARFAAMYSRGRRGAPSQSAPQNSIAKEFSTQPGGSLPLSQHVQGAMRWRFHGYYSAAELKKGQA